MELFARSLTTNLLENDSKTHYGKNTGIRQEADQLIRKLPNYQEYLSLPEYENLIKLLQKGIGIHHSGFRNDTYF